jgi:hypothetical protein
MNNKIHKSSRKGLEWDKIVLIFVRDQVEHLVILVHGLHGSSGDLEYFKTEINNALRSKRVLAVSCITIYKANWFTSFYVCSIVRGVMKAFLRPQME